LVLSLHKLVDRSMTGVIQQKILKVYSNILANSDSQKINDLVMDLILKGERFFRIQYHLLESTEIESFHLVERFLKGISRELGNHNIKMVKKKFYQVFGSENLEEYMSRVRYLWEFNRDELGKIQREGRARGESEEKREKWLQSQENKLLKKYLMTCTYYIQIFLELFFQVKGTQKQIEDKVRKMELFLKNRQLEMEYIEQEFSIIEIEEWPHYHQYLYAVESCQDYIRVNKTYTTEGRRSLSQR